MCAEVSEEKREDDSKKPFRQRLKLWWDGYELQAKAKALTPVDDSPEPDDGPPTVHGWSVSRQRSVITLFGDGMTRCIPDGIKKKLTAPMGVNKTLSVAELGSGLGGFSHWTVDKYETYVDAYEEDQDLVDASTDMTKMAGMFRYIKYHKCDFENFKPKLKSANVAYASEALFCVKNKQDCLNKIVGMMKPEGQIMISDYMLDGASHDHPELLKWIEAEPNPPVLTDVQEMRAMMTTAGFEVSIAEDTTEEYKTNVLKAFTEYAARSSRGEKSGHLHDWVLREGELWTARVKAMESGALKVFRIYARVPREIM